MSKKKGLGKGFDALFPKGEIILKEHKAIQEIPLAFIHNNPDQPRKDFPLQELEELANSIKIKGILQPIIVRKKSQKTYEIVAGERRWRASKIAGLKKIKAIVYNVPLGELREIALIENIQRMDLNPIEEAIAYHSLLEKNSLTQEQLAKKVGKKRASIANILRLLSLPSSITNGIIQKKISVGQAKCLLSLSEEKEQEYFLELIIKKNLTVRELELAIKKNKKTKSKKKRETFIQDEHKEALIDFLQTNIEIRQAGSKGAIVIQFYNQKDFQRILEKIIEK